MKISIIAVGRVRGTLAELVNDYERRAAHYFPLETVEVRERSAKNVEPSRVMEEEGKRLLARVPAGAQVIALDRQGKQWSSEALSEHLEALALHSAAGVAFLIGGAFGLSHDVLRKAERCLSLSAMTFPHEIARLLLVEQIYRAGTIARGEPYHKARR